MSFINLSARIGTSIQAYNAKLADLAGLSLSTDSFIGSDGSNIVIRSASQAKSALAITTSDVSGLGSLATKSSIDWTSSDITNKPVLFSGDYNDLTNKPTLFSGAYADLSGLPTLGTASSLNTGTSAGNIPVLDGSGKLASSVLPAVAVTSVSVVADNTARDALTVQEGDIAVVTADSKSYIYDGSVWVELKAPSGSGSVSSVNGYTGTVVLTASDLSLATVATTGDYNDLSNKPTLFSGSYTDLSDKPTLFSGSYNDLTNKPTIISTLAGLTDVDTTGATTGSVLKYNSVSSKWEVALDATGSGDTGYASDVIVKTNSGNVVLTNTNHIVVVKKVSGEATTVTLPAGSAKKMFVIKDGKGDANVNNITIATSNSETIDGSSTKVISVARDSITVVWDGSEWAII